MSKKEDVKKEKDLLELSTEQKIKLGVEEITKTCQKFGLELYVYQEIRIRPIRPTPPSLPSSA